MASVSISANGCCTSPYIYSTATVSEKSRSGTSVTLNISLSTNLQYSSSYLGTGYKLTGTVTAYGNTKSITIKNSSDSWSGSSAHTNTATMSITVPANITSITIGYKCAISGLESGTATGTNKNLSLSNVLATVSAVTSFTDTTNPRVTFSNPGGFKLRPYMNIWTQATNGTQLGGTIYAAEIGSTGGSISSPYTWSLTENQINDLRNRLGTRTTAYATVGMQTYSGSTSLGTSSKGANITNVLSPPTFTDFEIEDSNNTTIAITGDNSKIILGYSTLRITINGTNKAIANKGATMKYYLINNTQYTYNEDFSVELANYNSNTITIQAVDSRGITTTVTKNISTANYTPLSKSSSSILRDGNVSEETQLNYSGSITSVLPNGNNNTIIASYKYKNIEDSTYITGTTDITPVSSNDSFSLVKYIIGDLPTGFEINNSYNIVVTVSDVLSSVEYSFVLGSGIPALAVKGNNIAIHGGYDEQLGGTQINGSLYINKQKYAYEKGEELDMSTVIACSGHITSSTTYVMVTVPTDYSLQNITSITPISVSAEARGLKGYLNSQGGFVEYVGKSGYTVGMVKAYDRAIRLGIAKSSAWTNVDNNTPVTLYVTLKAKLN